MLSFSVLIFCRWYYTKFIPSAR